MIHNAYAGYSGEERVVELQHRLLESRGHRVILYGRSSAGLRGWKGAVNGFLSGFCNRRSARELKALIAAEKPDAAIVHNLYPLISPAVNRNHPGSDMPMAPRKLMADLFIDDRNLGGLPEWGAIYNTLKNNPQAIFSAEVFNADASPAGWGRRRFGSGAKWSLFGRRRK
ncbi:hypothetical protein FACS1894159_11500 [Bacteroidia bacterium]|nr:hypothetical protein FACS1894159_11500 [Bacteroidia bacterium]